MRFFFVWRRPAVSTKSFFVPRAFAAASASKRTAEGSAPSRCRTIGTSSRSAQTSSCSIAPARNVSAAARRTGRPAAISRAASFAVVVVLPEPLTPTRKITSSGTSGTAAGLGAREMMASISSTSTRFSSARSAPDEEPPRRRMASASAPAVSAPTSASRSTSSSDSRTVSSNPKPFLTASPNFSRISVWVMKSPRRTLEKKADFPVIAGIL